MILQEQTLADMRNDGNVISTESENMLIEQLKSEEFPDSSHIGLANVHQRIKIIFGEYYGCNVTHTNTETVINIKIPKKMMQNLPRHLQ